jgi:hypothetical protein
MLDLEFMLNTITGMNLHTLAFFVVTIWYFTKDIRSDLKAMKTEMHASNTRLSRVEGTVYGKKMYDEKGE